MYSTLKQNDMKATLTFTTNEQAEQFATIWSRTTCTGHTVFKKQVHVYDIDETGKKFIDNYMKQINNK